MDILLVRVSSLGDVLHNLPMVADLLRHQPDARIDWVVEEAFVSLVRRHPQVREVIPFALRRWRKSLGSPATRAEIKAFWQRLRARQYDIAFDTQGLLKTGLILGAARARRKVGLGNGSEGSGYEGISRIFHTESVKLDPRTHAVARGRLVAAHALGYTLDTPPDFGLRPADALPRPDWMPLRDYAVFFHGTARRAKQWPIANWIEIGRQLAPMPVLLPWGSEQERQDAEAIAAGLKHARMLPRLSMDEAIALAQHAAMVIGVDTGLTHIAAAYLRPTIELYCDSPRWKTEGDWSSRIINLGDRGDPPEVAEVMDAVRKLEDIL
ncbi:lipopolysaccharide heptosyltransferase I [Massilia sp. TS11]|uniref:lipopolysaccharide heptosyltransferase I n=1 Tax=Massilia sp. TS11 TaxID=2908003 RepID=UPI001EDAE3FD|nr:lipopolysaccharide heptosyltransferase I [Massilia sp. TS11]MCG2583476.1 lipopolysaccharide heptosyltransferase I [Massilia sp. TS11]